MKCPTWSEGKAVIRRIVGREHRADTFSRRPAEFKAAPRVFQNPMPTVNCTVQEGI